jgi:hypothetical protein
MGWSADRYEHLLVDYKSPDQCLEPILDAREAGMRYIDVLNAFADHIEASLTEGNLRSVQVSYWTVCFAVGLKRCGGMAMTERERQLGVRHGTIAKGAKAFIELHGLSPSCFMRNGNGANGANE